ncbi:MAG: sulfotransferase family 2 domain-containing protein [Woeseia sp.]
MQELLYAHVHIPKTAGTTLIHLLRRNFFPRCMDVRPFEPSSNGILRAKDLRKSLRINPALQCITGHSIRPNADLESIIPDIRYFTILRDPVKRFISAYLYLNDVMKQDLTFEQHLKSEQKRNIQTRWIAGVPDLDLAKSVLNERFCLVGRTDRLNEFILLLARQLQAYGFDPVYRSQNLAVNRGREKIDQARVLEQRYGAVIRKNNQLDVELMNYLDTVIMPRQQKEYGATLAADLTAFENEIAVSRPPRLLPYLDYAIRKFYYDPIIGSIRLMNGMQYRGSF